MNFLKFHLQWHQNHKIGINLTPQNVQDLYTKNYKTAERSQRTVAKSRAMLCSWDGSLNIVNISVLPKFIYRFNTIQKNFSLEIDKLILKCLWKYVEPSKYKAILKNNKIGGLGIFTSRHYFKRGKKWHYKTSVIKTVWYLQKSQQRDQRNRIQK